LVKEKATISFTEGGTFTLENGKLVTEFTGEGIQIGNSNIQISPVGSLSAPTGNVTILYRPEGESEYGETLYPVLGNCAVKVIVAEDANYVQTEAEIMLQIKPAKLTITAKDQTIVVNDGIVMDQTAVILSGTIIENDPALKAYLETALPDLINMGAIQITLDNAVDLSFRKP